jgi:ferric uptake regulation protein
MIRNVDETAYLEELKLKLKDEGFKLTHQRRNIVEVLLSANGKHMSSEEIYDIVKKDCPEIGLATVYRTLQVLDKLGYTNKLNLDDGCVRYELSLDKNAHNHHHLVCKKCSKIIEVEEDLLDQLEDVIKEKYGFDVENHDVKFNGYCSNCSKSAK